MKSLHVVTDRRTLRDALATLRTRDQPLGLVPTMGALHEGHLSLVRRSVRQCARTAVTVFVNPTQFGPHEDFSRYPHTLDADLEALESAQADLVFVPSIDEIYPPGFSAYVEPPNVAKPLEGICRPGHFRGVATVVLKLFHLVPADVAYFGQKDYQQCRVIQDMVRDLDLPIRIEVCPIVRESDGLAMSSRNRYLSPAERRQALALYHSLQHASDLVRRDCRDASQIVAQMRSVLETAGIERIDYVALADPQTLADVSRADRGTMALIAAHVGTTRLIDNCQLG